jgi:uncharacterized phage infection (PIP) family protein YhgE
MTDDSPTDDLGAADAEAFEEWLDQAADSKGVSRQELMNQMLSSYWILDELTGLVGEAEFDGSADHRSPGPTDSTPETGADDSDPADSSESPSTEESIREIHVAIQELVNVQSSAADQQTTDSSASGAHPTFDEGVVSVVSDLQRQVGKFESKLDDVVDRQDTQFDRLSNELQLLLDRVNELERTRNRYAEKDEIDALADDVGELNSRLDELRATDEQLESRMDREFDSIEELFHRLLNALDDLDSDLEAATDSYRSELEPIQRRESERKRLEELKTDALRREIRRATCESCDQRVDLGLLESTACPNCTARFTGIDDSGWNPFRSPTLKTEMGRIDRS